MGRREGEKEGGRDREDAEEDGDGGSPTAGACPPAFVCVAAEFPNPASPTPPRAFRVKTLPAELFCAAGMVVDLRRTACEEEDTGEEEDTCEEEDAGMVVDLRSQGSVGMSRDCEVQQVSR